MTRLTRIGPLLLLPCLLSSAEAATGVLKAAGQIKALEVFEGVPTGEGKWTVGQYDVEGDLPKEASERYQGFGDGELCLQMPRDLIAQSLNWGPKSCPKLHEQSASEARLSLACPEDTKPEKPPVRMVISKLDDHRFRVVQHVGPVIRRYLDSMEAGIPDELMKQLGPACKMMNKTEAECRALVTSNPQFAAALAKAKTQVPTKVTLTSVLTYVGPCDADTTPGICPVVDNAKQDLKACPDDACKSLVKEVIAEAEAECEARKKD